MFVKDIVQNTMDLDKSILDLVPISSRSSPLQVCTANLDGEFVTPQLSWEEYTGQSWENQQKHGWHSMIPEEELGDFLTTWRRVITTKTFEISQHRLWHRSGCYRPVSTHLIPLATPYVLCASLDIQTLQSPTDPWRLPLSPISLGLRAANLGIWKFDPQTNLIFLDPHASAVFGLQNTQTILSISDIIPIIHPDDRPDFLTYLYSEMSTATPTYFESRIIRPNEPDVVYVVKSRGRKVIDDTSKVCKSGVVWDATEEVKEKPNRMESPVLELQGHWLEVQDLMHMLCHEVRTPLTGLQGAIDWLSDLRTDMVLKKKNGMPKLNEKMKDWRKKIKEIVDINSECVAHLEDVVTNILENAKIEEGKIQLVETIFNPDDVVLSVVRMQRANKLGLEKHLEVIAQIEDHNVIGGERDDIEMGKPHYLVKGDAGKLKIIIINLVSNAIKFTPLGSVAVSLNYERDPVSSDMIWCHVKVKDTGVGLTHEEQKELFQKFTQLKTNGYGTGSGSGSGLGLFIVKGYVAGMGGDITVKSKKGVGTTFVVKVPFWLVEEEQSGNKPPEQELFCKSSPRVEQKSCVLHHLQERIENRDPGILDLISRTRVLVVEDNQINQKILAALLKKKGFSFQLANDGREAVEMIKKSVFHVILMDIQMPVMNGYEATMEIRKYELENDCECKIPIIGLSGNSGFEDKNKGLKCGMQDYMIKPFKADIIISQILYWVYTSYQHNIYGEAMYNNVNNVSLPQAYPAAP
eukprot:TRINITY_DN5274_c0_g1_i3.p1 TRINITY_DN5274_c0_g1~~TRINITY_DN5274_c0_g1_i3.p1  ORF type:complete len:749 (-),score=141.82 TRINITY_DN5274_c0_g1_i3:53-2299(-)